MSNFQPFITIITPVYNAGKYIIQCIESVQSQKYTDFEHLIVDGLSIDNTIELVHNCQTKFPNLRLLSEKDKGVYDAMNKGIRNARGEWLYFLGADDYFYDTSVLEAVASHLKTQDNGIIYGNVYYQSYKRLYDGEFDIEKILRHNVCHQAVFYNKSVFNIIGYYNLKYRTEADYDFNLRCWLNGYIKCLYIPLTIANYSEGGISSTARDQELVKDYPDNTTLLTLNSNRSFFSKIDILSKIYRKLMQRHSLRFLMQQVIRRKFIAERILAFIWCIVMGPFYVLKKIKSSHNE